VIVDVGAAIAEAHRRKIPIEFRKALLDCATKDGLVAGGRNLLLRGQSRGVDVGRVRHSQLSCFQSHEPCELAFAAADRFAHHHRGIIRRPGAQAFDRIVDRNGLIRLEAELGGRLDGGLR